MGMLRPSAGKVTVQGHDASADGFKVRERAGYVADEPTFFDYLTGREHLDLSRMVRGLPEKPTLFPRMEALSGALALTDDLKRLTADYSLGMRKKLALLLALIHSPALLLLDEPLNGLDPTAMAAALQMLRDFVAETQAAIVFATHHLEAADEFCTRVVLLRSGKIAVDTTPAAFRERVGLKPRDKLESAYRALIG